MAILAAAATARVAWLLHVYIFALTFKLVCFEWVSFAVCTKTTFAIRTGMSVGTTDDPTGGEPTGPRNAWQMVG